MLNLCKDDKNLNELKKIYNKNNDIVNLQNVEEENCLIVASKVISGNWQVLNFLINETIVDINSLNRQRFSAFTYACKNNNDKLAQLLLDKGLYVYNIRTTENLLPISYISDQHKMQYIIMQILSSPNKKTNKAIDTRFSIDDEKFKIFTENFNTTLDSSSGSYGDTFLVKDDLGKEYMLKRFKSGKLIDFTSLKEIYTMKYLNSINKKCCVHLYGIMNKNGYTYLVMEPLTYTIEDIAFNYKNVSMKLDKKEFIHDMFYILVKNLYYIHSSGIFHSDIKSGNIMIDNENYPRFIDFGLSQFLSLGANRAVYGNYYCTAYTKAPDSLEKGIFKFKISTGDVEKISNKINYTTDIFSLAQVFMEFLFPENMCQRKYITYNGKLIFRYYEQLNEGEVYHRTDHYITEHINSVFPELLDLLINMCKTDSNERYTALDCLRHPFFEEKFKNEKEFKHDDIKEKKEIINYENVVGYKKIIEYEITDYDFTKNTEIVEDKEDYCKPFLSPFEKYFSSEYYSTFIYRNILISEFKNKCFESITTDENYYSYFFEQKDFFAEKCSKFGGNLDALVNTIYITKKYTYEFELVHYFYESFFDEYGYIAEQEDDHELSIRMLNNVNIFEFIPVKLHIYYICYKLYNLSLTSKFIENLINYTSRQVIKWYYLSHAKEFPVFHIVKNIVILYLSELNLKLPEDFYQGYDDDNEIINLLSIKSNDTFSTFLDDKTKTFIDFSNELNIIYPNMYVTDINSANSDEYIEGNLYSLQQIFYLSEDREEIFNFYNKFYNEGKLDNKTTEYGNDELFEAIVFDKEFTFTDIVYLLDCPKSDISFRNFCLKLLISSEDKIRLFKFFKKGDDEKRIFLSLSQDPKLVENIYNLFFMADKLTSQRMIENVQFFYEKKIKDAYDFFYYLFINLTEEENFNLIKCCTLLNIYDIISFKKYLNMEDIVEKCIMIKINNFSNYERWLEIMSEKNYGEKITKLTFLTYNQNSRVDKEKLFYMEDENYPIVDTSHYFGEIDEDRFFPEIFLHVYKFSEEDLIREAIFFYTSVNSLTGKISPYTSLYYKKFKKLFFPKQYYSGYKNVNWEFEKELSNISPPLTYKNTSIETDVKDEEFPTLE